MKKVVLVLAAAVLLGGAFIILKPKPVNSPPSVTNPGQSMQNKIPTKVFELIAKDHKLVSGSDTISVTEGDDVTLKITSDEDEELHLHGYDISIDLEKNKPAELHFIANLTGNFPFELEKSKTDLGSVQVQPK